MKKTIFSIVCMVALALGMTSCGAVGIVGAVWGGERYISMLETMCEPLAWWLFTLGAAIVIIIVYAILVARTWHTANANPVDMIKSE